MEDGILISEFLVFKHRCILGIQPTLMKAMATNQRGDSVFYTRLLSYLKNSGFRPEKIQHVNGDVHLIRSENKSLIIKGFSNYRKWESQEILTSVIKKNGFNSTYRMLAEERPFDYENKVYAGIEYLPPAKTSFNYRNDKNRQNGLEVLNQFHQASVHALPNLKSGIPLFDQHIKWRERLLLFKEHLPVIREYVEESILDNWIRWAEWSLSGLQAYERLLYSENSVVIHGDCAHHNFLRKQNGELTLIDFDLISEAPPIIDFLQYANRILPHLNNPEETLWSYPELKKYRHNRAFLYALIYPADIFREWNRLVKEEGYLHSKRLHSVWKLSVENYSKRMKFNRSIAKLLS